MTTKRKKKMINNKRQIRSALSNKMIQNREVILVSEIVDYLKQDGYIVIPPRNMQYLLLCIFWFLWMSTMGLI